MNDSRRGPSASTGFAPGAGDRETFATFVLSTGRCGTQWLAEKLKAAYPDRLRVEHEPLHDAYEPRRMLGSNTPSAALAAHAEDIERRLETGPYLECGHPCWSSLPWLIDQLPGRVRIVHLTRHPVPTALSWLTHSAYLPPLLPHLGERVLLTPFDPGVAFPRYQSRWPALQPFEKCLYYWAEVNAFGLRLAESARVPWLRLRYEDLFEGPALEELLAFLDLPPRKELLETRREVVDRHRFVAPCAPPDLAVLESHEPVLSVASALGYDVGSPEPLSFLGRYIFAGETRSSAG